MRLRLSLFLPMVCLAMASACLAPAPTPQTMPPLPAPDARFVLGTAGAPAPLFGPAHQPTYSTAFAALADDGFNVFVPVFLTHEDGEGTSHGSHFQPADPRLGVPTDASCEGPHGAWQHLPDGLRIAFPLYLLTADLNPHSTWASDDVRARVTAFRTRCLHDVSDKLAAAYLQDEAANGLVAGRIAGDPDDVLENVHTLADAGRDVLGVPTMMVEAALPFYLPYYGVPSAQTSTYATPFWTAQAMLAPAADQYGFDLYPVDLTHDLSAVPAWVQEGRARVPNATPFFVLQGASFVDQGIAMSNFVVPQGQGLGAGRQPSAAETRAMAYAAVAAGAQALYWYGQSTLKSVDDPLWTAVRAVVRDLRRLSGVLAKSGTYDVQGAVHARRIPEDSGHTILLANTAPASSSYETTFAQDVHVFDALTGARLETAPAGKWQHALEAHGTAILRIVTAQ